MPLKPICKAIRSAMRLKDIMSHCLSSGRAMPGAASEKLYSEQDVPNTGTPFGSTCSGYTEDNSMAVIPLL